mmetsp:Transcript_55297/g.160522  ORF Transcript_55297/g.160522 Transcript_55297/m.160522 type:complete len:253 (-) Transcript_55297:28-786(-)
MSSSPRRRGASKGSCRTTSPPFGTACRWGTPRRVRGPRRTLRTSCTTSQCQTSFCTLPHVKRRWGCRAASCTACPRCSQSTTNIATASTRPSTTPGRRIGARTPVAGSQASNSSSRDSSSPPGTPFRGSGRSGRVMSRGRNSAATTKLSKACRAEAACLLWARPWPATMCLRSSSGPRPSSSPAHGLVNRKGEEAPEVAAADASVPSFPPLLESGDVPAHSGVCTELQRTGGLSPAADAILVAARKGASLFA